MHVTQQRRCGQPLERLQQGESLNVQDVKTNLFWEFGKFTSNELTRNNLQVSQMQVNVQFLQQLQPEWSRFVTIVEICDVLKQFQNEVNDIRSERLARSANPLALLYFKKLYKPTNNDLRTSSNSRNKTEDPTPRYNNDNQSGQCGKQKTVTVSAYHKEKMMMCKQAEQGVPLQAEQADWLEDM
ncbi:hypothetical protein Tco_0129865 [Tanacetum coccineum]